MKKLIKEIVGFILLLNLVPLVTMIINLLEHNHTFLYAYVVGLIADAFVLAIGGFLFLIFILLEN